MIFNFFKKNKDVEFSVTGIIKGEEETVIYRFKKNKGTIECNDNVKSLVDKALKSKKSVGPVGQYMDRDINNPLAMLFILNSNEIFETIKRVEPISGTMPVAARTPKGSIS